MEEEMSRSTMTKTDASDSNSSNSPPQKHKPSSRYKGVVPQTNGHWGAQIYANHSRIWLGTFKNEDLAAAAYDSAAIKLRHGNSADPHRNFPLTERTMHEPGFQENYSTNQVLNMIKDGSYDTKFSEFLSQINGLHTSPDCNVHCEIDGYYCKELFRKELTPSDVGKLNRLVIPKRYAQKYFNLDEGDGDTELIFYDKSMRSWTFRYCYWRSSSSFVFTRGWNGFVKAKDLKATDIVAFFHCELRENNYGNDSVKKVYMIDIVGCNENNDTGVSSRNMDEIATDNQYVGKVEKATNNIEMGFRLFGVHIIPDNCGGF